MLRQSEHQLRVAGAINALRHEPPHVAVALEKAKGHEALLHAAQVEWATFIECLGAAVASHERFRELMGKAEAARIEEMGSAHKGIIGAHEEAAKTFAAAIADPSVHPNLEAAAQGIYGITDTVNHTTAHLKGLHEQYGTLEAGVCQQTDLLDNLDRSVQAVEPMLANQVSRAGAVRVAYEQQPSSVMAAVLALEAYNNSIA